MSITFADIEAARDRIASGVYATPCPESIPLSQLCDAQVFCKLEYLQRTGSFKERGARNALLLLDQEQRSRGVIAASAGNHALALAWHGQLLHTPVTVVMPRQAPLIKQMNCRRMGAEVILHGDTFDAAKAHARSLCDERGLTYVHGFDDPAIIAGQGTIGLEVLEQVPNLDAVVAPIGGAGLAAGVSLAVKHARPEVQVLGVEPRRAASFTAALEAGKPVRIGTAPTLADGLAVARVGDRAFDIARRYVDQTVEVSEDLLALAILRLMEMEKAVVEGAGAAPLAALLGDLLPQVRGKRVALLLCGGNIDLTVLGRLIESGLVVDGRLARFSAVVSDRPGGLAHLANILAGVGASIYEVTHDRAFAGADVSTVNVVCTVETRDRDHIVELYQALADNDVRFRALESFDTGAAEPPQPS